MSWVAVPSEMKASPGRTAPMPIAPTAASPPPAATTTSRGSPSSSATPRARRPTGCDPSASGGTQRRIDAARRQRLGRPAPLGFVEPPRSGGVAHVGALFPGQTETQIVLGQQHVSDAREDLRLMATQPHELRRGEARHRLDADDVGETAAPLPEFAGLGEGARVVVQHRRPQRAVVAAEDDRAVHLAGKADRADAAERFGRASREVADRGDHRRAPDVRVLLGPQRVGMVRLIGARRRRRGRSRPRRPARPSAPKFRNRCRG